MRTTNFQLDRRLCRIVVIKRQALKHALIVFNNRRYVQLRAIRLELNSATSEITLAIFHPYYSGPKHNKLVNISPSNGALHI